MIAHENTLEEITSRVRTQFRSIFLSLSPIDASTSNHCQRKISA